MLNDKTYSDVNNLARTLEEKNIFLNELDILANALFASDPGAFDTVLNKSVRAKTAGFIKQRLAEGEEKQALVSSLKKFVDRAKIIKITLAFEPREETLDKLFSWVMKNIGLGAIMDVSYDESIVGGAIVAVDGKYRDLSLKKRINELFQNGKGPNIKLSAQ